MRNSRGTWENRDGSLPLLQVEPGSPEDYLSDQEPEMEEEEGEVQRKKDRWTRRKINTDLILAILDSDLEKVKRLIGPTYKISPMVRCQQRMVTVTHLAALRGEEEILRELIASCKKNTGSAKLALEARDSQGRQPHHLATAAGQAGTLRIILEEEPELINSQAEIVPLDNLREEDMDSFLHDHFEVNNLLMTVSHGSTALHIASKYSYLPIVEYLLEKGADVNILDKEGLTPLDVAGVYADPSVPGTIVGAAVPATYSLDPQIQSHEFFDAGAVAMTPFSLDSGSPLQYSAPSGFKLRTPSPKYHPQPTNTTVSVVSKIMTRGGKLSGDPKATRTTPLHRFVERADMEAIDDILRPGGKRTSDALEAVDGQGRTPIHLAVELNLIEPLKLMLSLLEPSKRILAVNAQDNKGRTPLHIAVQYEYGKIIEILLEEQTDLRVQTEDGENILHVAARKKNPEIITTLLERTSRKVIKQADKSGYTPLARAVETGDVRCVELFLDFGSPIRTIKGSRNTLIHIAVKSMALNVLRLLSVRSDFDYNVQNSNGYCPIHLAVDLNSLDCLQFLVDLTKVDIKAKTKEGSTALHIAAQKGNKEAAEIILEVLKMKNVLQLVKEQDGQGREPLILSALGGHAECVALLLRHGANLAARDGAPPYLTALDLMHYNIPNAARLLDDIMDNFMEVRDVQVREDSPNFSVGLDFKCFLADTKKGQRQLGVVEAFIKCKHERLRKALFLHPLTESFLYFKWKQLEVFYLILVLIFIIHLCALTGYGLCHHVYQDHSFLSKIIGLCRITVWTTLVPLVVFEIMTFRWDKTYLMDAETWVKWPVLVLSAVSVSPDHTEPFRIVSALAVLLAWLQLLFLVARGQKWGLRVLMFLEVVANVMQVLSTFFFLPLGFAFSFLILFNKKHPFEGLGETFSKVVVMMVELDYAGFYGAEPDSSIDNAIAYEFIGRCVYLGFVILVVMVFNNLILGMSTADVQEIENQGRFQRVSKQASFLVLFEKLCYESRMPKYAVDIIKSHIPENDYSIIFPNKKRDTDKNILPRDIRMHILETVSRNSGDHESTDQRIESLAEEVHKLRKAFEKFQDTVLGR